MRPDVRCELLCDFGGFFKDDDCGPRESVLPCVKQHLTAIRMLFDWLVTGQVVPVNPAHAGRGPRHSVKKVKRRCTRGMQPALARLTVARKMAAIVLKISKKGERFDPQRLKNALKEPKCREGGGRDVVNKLHRLEGLEVHQRVLNRASSPANPSSIC